jgi:glycosyltransferase involved in cell wall biosynthesis
MRDRLHVAYVIGSLHVGGTQKHLYDLIRKLDKHRFRCSLILFHDGGEYYDRFSALGVRIYSLDIRSRSDLVRRFPKFLRLLKELQPDVLHLLLYMSSLYGCLASLLMMRHRPRVIVSKRSMENDVSVTRRLAYRSIIMKVPHVITAVSDPVSQRCAELGARRERIITIGNGIDTIHPGPAGILKTKLNIGPDAVLIGTVGSLTERKQQVALIEMLPHLLHRDSRVHLVLIGEGPLRPALLKHATTLGISDRVHFPGSLVPATDYLADLSAFLLPSAEEGTSNALLEALAVGIPCVASNIPSNAAVLAHRADGLLVDPRDPEAFASAVHEVLSDKVFASQLVAAGRAKITRSYSLSAMVRENENLYAALASRTRSALLNAQTVLHTENRNG